MNLYVEKYLLEDAISEAHLAYNGRKNDLKMSVFLANSEDYWEDAAKMKKAVRKNILLCQRAKRQFRIAQRNYTRFMREHGKEFKR